MNLKVKESAAGIFGQLVAKITKLIDVKSIITLVLTGTAVYLWITTQALPGDLKDIYLIIISFYFGMQTQKRADESDGGPTLGA
jgi:hypothetical protein